MKNTDLRNIVETSLFAALIFLGVSVFRIPMPFTTQFVHFGNALVVVGCLLFGTKRGALAASIGLGIFDLLNGYASVVWETILESLIVCYVIHLVYENLLKKNDKIGNIIAVGVVAAIVKIIVNIIKYTFLRGMIVGGLALTPAFIQAINKITGTFGSAIFTVVAVPIVYPLFKEALKRVRRYTNQLLRLQS